MQTGTAPRPDHDDPSASPTGGRSIAAPFVLINGLVLAAVLFAVLHFLTGDMKMAEMRRVTRDIVQMTDNAIRATERSVTALAHFYAEVGEKSQDEVADYYSVPQLLTEGGASLGMVIWATDKNVWYMEDLAGKTRVHEYRANIGWPSYRDLMNVMASLPYGHVGYIYRGAWPVFSQPVSDPGQAPLALVTKIRLPQGGTGVLLAMTTPESILGRLWSERQDDISRVTIRSRESGHVLFDKRFHIQSGVMELAPETVTDTLQLGGQYWELRFDMRPSGVATAIGASPWIAVVVTLLVTMLVMVSVERRQRQEKKLDEMSRTLKGAHSELQNRISERDQLFHALRKSERENRAVINSVSDVIFETDETGKIVFLNETWKRITHAEVADTVGQSLFQLIDPADQLKQKEMFEELVRGERQAYRIETRLAVGHDSYKPVEIAFSMLRMAEDKTIRVVGTITDIEKRRRAEAAMRQAEQRFRSIVENSVSGIYQLSPEGKFLSANPALAEILGYDSPADLIDSVNDIGADVYANPEDRKVFVDKLLFEGRVTGVETEVIRKDGKKIWIMENARVVRSEKGKVEYFEGSIWDVTERKLAEDAMRDARLQAEISSRTRMEFLANMSHELRTPLNAVIGFAEIIKDEVMGKLGVPVYKEYAQDIYDSGNHLLKIISEILEVSKIDTGNRELAVTNFRLARALKSCMTIMSSRVDQAKVSVRISLPEDLPEILAEELGIKQIMLNLIGNAIKFTPEGGSVDVTARVDNATGEMQIDVTDTGIGMSEDEIKKAMQPFGKVDNNFSTMKAGTGLGLTIVESLVGLHGGRFQLISEKGKGTTARVILPPFRVLRPQQDDAGHLKVVS